MSDGGSDTSWRGVPITQIYGAESPWGAPEFPLVRPAGNHSVLYHVESDGTLRDRPPKPQMGKDLWDQYHVRLPCSSHSLYPVRDESGETHLKKRWGLIQKALSKPIRNSQELADAILSYNTKFKDKWRFNVLHKLFNKYLEKDEMRFFFDVTLPEIVKLALDLPKLIQAPIPLQKQHKNHSVSLSQQQIASLLANAFFCTFPRRNSSKRDSEYSSYPSINFSRLYESASSRYALEKMKCICHYFRRVCSKVPTGVVTFCRRSVPPQRCPDWERSTKHIATLPLHADSDVYIEHADGLIQVDFTFPTGVVTFCRRSVPPQRCPDWERSTKHIATLPLHADSDVYIEHADGLIQVDFANRFLGGGVLGHGCVQEEIRFIICPELIASMIFTEEMRPNEAVLIIGVEQYSEYTGYGDGFEWAGNYQDNSPRDSSARKRCAVLAIDALSYSRDVNAQYRHENLNRELNKAWVGFSFFTADQTGVAYPGVATGNWGCGVYRGSPHLKSLLQMMACTEASRPMAYYTFQDTELRDDIVNMYNVLSRYGVTVGQLYKHILNYCKGKRSQDLHTYLHQVLKQGEQESSKDQPELENLEPEEPMDVSSDHEATNVPVEGRHLDNRSPDLFSQDLTTEESTAVSKVAFFLSSESEKGTQNSHKTVDNNHADDNEPNSDENKVQNCKATAEASQTSRLFEEMEKLDENSGKLNLNTTHDVSLFDANTSLNNSMSIDNEHKIQMELSPQTKKKISGKITDYFKKKGI